MDNQISNNKQKKNKLKEWEDLAPYIVILAPFDAKHLFAYLKSCITTHKYISTTCQNSSNFPLMGR